MNNRTLPPLVTRILSILGGAVVGAMIGLYTTLAIIVAKARAGYFLFSTKEVVAFNVESATIFAGILAGAFLAYRMPVRSLRALVRGLVGLLAGGFIGVAAGFLIGQSMEWAWSGAVIGSALALLALMAFELATAKQRRLTRTDLAAAGVVGLAVGAVLLIGLMVPEPPALIEVEPAPLPPASAVDEVVFIIGDAGSTKAGHTPLLSALRHDVEHWSAALARDSAVSVVYAGDLVYPVGVRDRSDAAFPQDSARLWNQIDLVGGPMARRYRSAGLFLPGNHDWGNTSDNSGISRIANLAEQLALARKAGLRVDLFPKGGAPGPEVRDVRDNIRFVFIDTHWFLRTRDRGMREGFLDALETALNPPDERHVIIVSHHPYQSAGPHGAVVPGYYSWGVDYLLRKTGAIVQDLNSVVYKELLDGMRAMFARVKQPPLVFAGGHDHSLQVIARQNDLDPAYMLVSGAGSKLTSIRPVEGMHYGAARPGYMKLVFRKDDAVDLFVIAGAPELLKCEVDTALETCMTVGENSFDIVYGQTLAEGPDAPVLADTTQVKAPDAEDTAPLPEETVANVQAEDAPEPAAYTRAAAWWTRTVLPASAEISDGEADRDTPPTAVPARMLYFEPDSVVTTTGTSYAADFIKRLVLGDLNRHLWDVPVRLPVLNLDTLGGGVRVDELSGGKQTLGLRLVGRDGVTYQFRSIVKDASRALDTEFQKSLDEVLQDQTAAQFPLSAMVVAELLDAVDVLVAKPIPVVMPNHERLGAYRPYFAGRVGWIEERPNELGDNRRGFAGSRKVVGGFEVYEELREDRDAYIDTLKYLRARFIDFLVSDWDRHSDNWRWARFEDQGRARWEPIPKDRDWAFTRSDGMASTVSPVVYGKFVGFSAEYPPLGRLATTGYRLDHRMLSGVPKAVFMAEARRVQQTLTDDVLSAALGVLPPEYQALERESLMTALQARRGYLNRMAEEFHALLSRAVHVYGYDDMVDTVRLETLPDNRVRVQAWTEGREAEPYFDQVLDAGVVQEIKLYLEEDIDVVEQPDGFPVSVTLLAPDTEEPEDGTY